MDAVKTNVQGHKITSCRVWSKKMMWEEEILALSSLCFKSQELCEQVFLFKLKHMIQFCSWDHLFTHAIEHHLFRKGTFTQEDIVSWLQTFCHHGIKTYCSYYSLTHILSCTYAGFILVVSAPPELLLLFLQALSNYLFRFSLKGIYFIVISSSMF